MKFLYFMKSEDGRLYTKAPETPYIFPHKKLKDVKPGFFKVRDTIYRNGYRLVTGENIAPVTEIADIKNFLFEHPTTTSIRKLKLLDGSEALLLIDSFITHSIIIDENSIEYTNSFPFVQMSNYDPLNSDTYEDMYIEDIEIFRSNLGLDFEVDYIRHKLVPDWLDEFNKLKIGGIFTKIVYPIRVSEYVTENIPLIVFFINELSKDILKKVIDHNISCFKYWKYEGISKIDDPDIAADVLNQLRKYKGWDDL